MIRNINQALQDLNTSVAINPDYVKAREERAKLLVETGNSESALTDYEEILKLSPANISVEQKRNLVKKQVQEILSDSDKPDYSKLFYMSGLAKISMGNYQQFTKLKAFKFLLCKNQRNGLNAMECLIQHWN